MDISPKPKRNVFVDRNTKKRNMDRQPIKKGGSAKKKRTKKQLRASADDSYGKFGSKAKKSGKINK